MIRTNDITVQDQLQAEAENVIHVHEHVAQAMTQETRREVSIIDPDLIHGGHLADLDQGAGITATHLEDTTDRNHGADILINLTEADNPNVAGTATKLDMLGGNAGRCKVSGDHFKIEMNIHSLTDKTGTETKRIYLERTLM